MSDREKYAPGDTAKLRIEAPFACASRSITTTRRPRRAAASAQARPTMPAPTTARAYDVADKRLSGRA